MKNIYKTLLLLSCFPLISFAKSEDYKSLQQECENNKTFAELDYDVDCGDEYHHYNTEGRVRRSSKDSLRISQLNALHPGNGKTRFKDYSLVAKMLSVFDLVAVTELIPAMADELRINKSVQEFSETIPREMQLRRLNIIKLLRLQKKKFSVVREREIALEKLIIKSYEKDLKRLNSVYRLPGYLKILNALRDLYEDDDWSLIISASPEGKESNPTKELVGFFYKASLVEPIDNSYCSRRSLSNGRDSFACHPLFDRYDLGTSKRRALSRRPFMGSFRAGDFETTLIASHSLFDSPKDESTKKYILQKAFGERSLDNFSKGITEGNYARFAELGITLELIQKEIEPNDSNHIIMLGDYNLESNNHFMPTVIKNWKRAKMFIDAKTSTTVNRFDSKTGEETYGLSRNYDHFILRPDKTIECMSNSKKVNGGVLDFINLESLDFIADKYQIRTSRKDSDGFYKVNKRKYNLIQSLFIDPVIKRRNSFLKIGKKTFTFEKKHKKTANGIIVDKNEIEKFTKLFYQRVIRTQLSDSTYYNHYEQVISDHLPIYMSCQI